MLRAILSLSMWLILFFTTTIISIKHYEGGLTLESTILQICYASFWNLGAIAFANILLFFSLVVPGPDWVLASFEFPFIFIWAWKEKYYKTHCASIEPFHRNRNGVFCDHVISGVKWYNRDGVWKHREAIAEGYFCQSVHYFGISYKIWLLSWACWTGISVPQQRQVKGNNKPRHTAWIHVQCIFTTLCLPVFISFTIIGLIFIWGLMSPKVLKLPSWSSRPIVGMHFSESTFAGMSHYPFTSEVYVDYGHNEIVFGITQRACLLIEGDAYGLLAAFRLGSCLDMATACPKNVVHSVSTIPRKIDDKCNSNKEVYIWHVTNNDEFEASMFSNLKRSKSKEFF